jgi:hypothetical protein
MIVRDKTRDFEVSKQSWCRKQLLLHVITAILQRFQHEKKTQENALVCSNQISRKSGLSSLKVERVNPLHFARSVFVNFR